MPQFSENQYLNSLLDNLISSYETEINYTPFEIELDPQQLIEKDIDSLIEFITRDRKRLFIFKIPGNESKSNLLTMLARRSVLTKNAEVILNSTSTEPKINPLKHALAFKSPTARARIQIQKSIALAKSPSVKKNINLEHNEQALQPDLIFVPLEQLESFPVLIRQLQALGITQIQEQALALIKEYDSAFLDGIIPNNLPKGFYISSKKNAFCYTDSPQKLPSALAPILIKQALVHLPSIEEASQLLTNVSAETIQLLLEHQYSEPQKNALLHLLSTQENEFNALLQSHQEFIIPLLCKQFILGGEAHALLTLKLLNLCFNKKINLDFLKNPKIETAFLSTRGIKNLQKLAQLPVEQKVWWNTLVNAHLNYTPNDFDFNGYFEAYTQYFLPRISDKNLTLPNPCPIHHQGHLLLTLNKVIDVIEHAANPQEQCLSLSNLNWGATGVHYAMLQKLDSERFKQVAACMALENPEDTVTNPELLYAQIQDENLQLSPWLYRYIGQHWKKEIRLSDIQEQILEIEKLASWTPVQKNQITFILTSSFADKTPISASHWKATLTDCIESLQKLNLNERSELLQVFSRCYQFKPLVSFTQINALMKQAIEFKTDFPDKNFNEDFLIPLASCLETEGFELFNTLQERIQKTDPSPETNRFSLSVISSFTTMLQKNRHTLTPEIIKLLAKLNEADLTQNRIDGLLSGQQNLNTKKGEAFQQNLFRVLSQINVLKSQPLPSVEHIIAFLEQLANSNESFPAECSTAETQELWLKTLIMEQNLLPGCVLGNGDISKLDDLIVDALVDAIQKRSAVFDVNLLKTELQKNLQSYIVPQQLRDQLNQQLMPLFDATAELVNLLKSPHPQFSEVIEQLRFFEEKKPLLLQGDYRLIIGETKGEYILSFLLTGKRKATDETTGKAFAAVLAPIHSLLVSKMRAFFDNPQNKTLVKDLNLTTCLSWMESFNDTHSLTFFFKEELIHKKVVPALKKTLQQLNTQDPDFEKNILDEATKIDELAPADLALQNYKNKIEAIANYLNLLIDINHRLPLQFNKIYQQLNTGSLSRLNYQQKQILVDQLIKDNLENLDLYLKLTTQALEEHPNADTVAIERAIHGLVELFQLSDLEPETQIMFFKMSITHNLKSASPFPLSALNEFKKSQLPEPTKALIIKKIIQILIDLSDSNPEYIQELVHRIQLFLIQNPEQAELCIALLNTISQENPNHDLSTYPLILQQLAQINPQNSSKIAIILQNLAKNKKDSTVNIPALLEITKGLGRRSPADIDRVLQLFTTPPYPNTQSLNSALLAHDSEKLQAFCSNFDTNPFAKNGEKRDLAKQFTTNRIKEGLLHLQDLLYEEALPHSLQMKLARQLTLIETLGYTDPLNPDDFSKLKKLTACSRHELKNRASLILQQLRTNTVNQEQKELVHLELLAYLREIYFRTTGLFPNTTQMLVLLLALEEPDSNLLMRIKTGEGKSINTPMLSVMQWAQGGTIVQWTANSTLLLRDYENSCEPFFNFLGIDSTLIQSNTPPESFLPNGINCSTVEDMASFHLAAKVAKKEKLLETKGPVHVILDECDDALLDQLTLYKIVAELDNSENIQNPAQWIYPLAHQFINLPAFRNIDPSRAKIWDEDEDLEQFRLFLNKQINERYNGDVEKQNYLMASSNTQLNQWIHASCIAATLVENKHFITQPIKEKNEAGQEIIRKIACVPLIRSTPKTGSIFTGAVQQALQARLIAECPESAQYIFIDSVPSVLASQSARGLIKLYQKTKGRLLGISATPGDKLELESLATSLGTQAISVAPYAGDQRINHPPIFTFSREQTIKTIHTTFDKIKCPISKPSMDINPDAAIQTHEEHEALIAQTKQAIEQWSHTQTRPVLIVNEDFDEAQIIGKSLEKYKAQGFKIQILTGKETPTELDKIIKRAGQVNTITVGTAMLAKGIDFNTAEHPKGLLVIQTYPDTENMSIQIAGRTARNGKPGEWLPIYQVKTPKDILSMILYYIFPWYRQRSNEHSITLLRNSIKLQATVDRIYTQSIDEAQQILMQQIEEWESLILELYPNDFQVQLDLYQWREGLLNELNRSQDTHITEQSLNENIERFKTVAEKLWTSAREDKWALKAEQSFNMNPEQRLRFNYLKQLELTQEFNVQNKLPSKGKKFTTGINVLMHQNLETVIADKAGAVLDYTKPSGEVKKELELAQCKQILPNLIGQFCAVCPEAIKVIFPKNAAQNSFIPEIVRSFIDKLIEQKNKVLPGAEQKEITESIIQFYQKKLANVDTKTIQELLVLIKPLIVSWSSAPQKHSLVEQFKMQGLILNFTTLYQNSGLTEDPELSQLQTSYDQEIMKKLAQYLIAEFTWAKESPTFKDLFERTAAKKAAVEIGALAELVFHSPQDSVKIQKLFVALQQHKMILKNKYLFSLRPSSPRNVITHALDAIAALHKAPHCDRVFQKNTHDKAASEHQLKLFRRYLANTSPNFFKVNTPTWEHMKQTLFQIMNQNQNNPTPVVYELYEAILRFSSYEAYQPYLSQLNAMKKYLLGSMEKLKEEGLNQDIQDSLFVEKKTRLAALLKVNPEQISLQTGTDGLQSFIEVEVEGAPLQRGFTGYQSTFLTRIETEYQEIGKVKSAFAENKDYLLKLSNSEAITGLSNQGRNEFEKLFRLKALLGIDWQNADYDRKELPEFIEKKLEYIAKLNQWHCGLPPTNLYELPKVFGERYGQHINVLIAQQVLIQSEQAEINKQLKETEVQINQQKCDIVESENQILATNKRLKEADCTYLETVTLKTKNIYHYTKIRNAQNQLTQYNHSLSILKDELGQFEGLNFQDENLVEQKSELSALLLEQIKIELNTYLENTSRQLVEGIEQEIMATELTLAKIQKEELKKMNYQKRRFSNTSALLGYEASLAQEEISIPLQEQEELPNASIFGYRY